MALSHKSIRIVEEELKWKKKFDKLKQNYLDLKILNIETLSNHNFQLNYLIVIIEQLQLLLKLIFLMIKILVKKIDRKFPYQFSRTSK